MSAVCVLDHLVVTAPTLDAGVRYIEQTLGCSMHPGGQHVRLGTHNALLRIGEDCYLEVIAIDPSAVPVSRTRWFDLDSQSAEHSVPRLATWVMRTPDIVATLAKTHFDFGPVEPMCRGALEWLITIPEDGRLLCEGIMPSLIEWKSPDLPASRLPLSGVSLTRLELHHPEIHTAQSQLAQCGLQGPVTFHSSPSSGTTELRAVFETARGTIVISSCPK